MSTPLLVTERLELWLPAIADMLPLHAVVSDTRTARYLGGPIELRDHHARFMRNAGSWALYGYGGLMLRERGQGAVIGNIGVFHSRRGIDPRFDDSGLFMEQLQGVFARRLPAVNTRIVQMSNVYHHDDPKTWEEVKANADAAIIGVGH